MFEYAFLPNDFQSGRKTAFALASWVLFNGASFAKIMQRRWRINELWERSVSEIILTGQKCSTRRKSCPCTPLSTTNPTRTALLSRNKGASTTLFSNWHFLVSISIRTDMHCVTWTVNCKGSQRFHRRYSTCGSRMLWCKRTSATERRNTVSRTRYSSQFLSRFSSVPSSKCQDVTTQ